MTVKEYTVKTNDLLKKLAEEGKPVSGIELGNDSKVGMNVMNVNGNASIVFSELDDEGNPVNINYCISIKDMDTARRFQIWINEIISVMNSKSLNEADSKSLVGGTGAIEKQ